MKKSVKALIGTVSALGIVEMGLCGFALYEVLNRNAKLPGKIIELDRKKKRKAKSDREKDNPTVVAKEPFERKYRRECEQWFREQILENYEIVNSRGTKLKGWLLPCEGDSKNYVFCSHGYRSSGKGDFGQIAKFYHDNGINVFLVDHQALGESEGIWISFGKFESEDCIQWLNFMINNFGSDINIFLHGISMGSATVMLMAGRKDLPQNVKFTIADCGYTSMRDEFNHNITLYNVPLFPLMQLTDFYNFMINKFRYDEVRPVDSVKNAKIPMLFFHGQKDNFVPTRMSYENYASCPTEKELVIVEGADHACSYQTNPMLYEKKISEYLNKYLSVKVSHICEM